MLKQIAKDIPTPCHLINIEHIMSNISTLDLLRKKAGVTLLFAIKGFSNDKIIERFIQNFDGVSASGLWEARLGKEQFACKVHTFSPAYSQNNFLPICKFSDYIIFNSIQQWNSFRKIALLQGRHCGLRINPEYSEVKKFSINPCHSASRFGVHPSELENIDFTEIEGLHFHSMCEQYSKTLLNTLNIIEKNFGQFLHRINWPL